ncbi:MAG: hypothetical protein C5B55_14005 [Blastocatellia bacterium]|nr:MAG: hypothetical protein C5B55_14005 [Blastocatellia bacterium]
MPAGRSIKIEREVLLFELERRCVFPDCNERASVSLTKVEALNYRGFECGRCERWNEDEITKKDAPFWWEEIRSAKH